MASKNEAKIKFSAETKEFSESIAEASKEISVLKSELKLNAVEMKNAGISAEALTKRQELLKKEQEAQQTKTKSLNSQLESAKRIYGEDSQEVAKLTKKLNASKVAEQNIGKEIKETNNQLKNQKNDTEKLATAQDKLKDSMDKVANGAGAVAGAAIATAGMTVKTFNEVDEGSDAAIIATGATGKAAEELEKTYKNVAGSVKGKFADIGSALGEVETRLGFTDKKAENCTTHFIKFAEVNKVDATEAVRLVSRAMGDAGIESDKYGTILDQLTVAAQASGIGVSNLAESLAKYGAPMRNLGFHTKESIALFAQWEKAGVNTSIAFSGMKKAISNWGAEGKDARVEFKKTLKEIKNTPDIASATAKAIEVFGTKAGPDLADAVKGGRFEYSKFLKILDKSKGSLENTYEAIQDGPDRAAVAMQNLKIAGAEVGETLLTQFEPVIGDIVEKSKEFVDYAEKHGDEIVATIETIGAVAGTVFVVNKVAKFTNSVVQLGSCVKTVAAGIKAAATAGEGLNLAMMTSPIGVTIAGVTALAAGIYILANNTEYLSEESQKAIDDMNELNSSISKSNESVETEFSVYEKQAEQLDKIVDKNGKVKKGKEDLAQAIVNNFENLGIEIDYVDDQIEGYKDLKKKIYDTIEAKKAEAYLEANKDEYLNALKQEKEYNDKITKQKEKIEKLEKTATKADKKAAADNELPEKYPVVGDAILAGKAMLGQDSNQKSMKAHAELEQAQEDLKNYEKTYKNATNAITNYDKLQVASASGKTEKIKNATNAYTYQLKRASNSTKEELEQQVSDTKKNVKRMEELYSEGKISKAAVDEAKRTRKLAKKELEKANAEPEGNKFGKSFVIGMAKTDPSNSVKKLTNKIKNQLKDIKTITMGVNVKIKPTSASLQGLQDAVFGNVKHNAQGNIVKSPILTTFAEEGPEAAIPINSKPRSRELWIETGRMMGMINTDMGNRSISDAVNMNETNRLLRQLVNKDFGVYMDSMEVSKSTAKSRDRIDGIDVMLKGRGVAVE